jgi:hypothetical protein
MWNTAYLIDFMAENVLSGFGVQGEKSEVFFFVFLIIMSY